MEMQTGPHGAEDHQPVHGEAGYHQQVSHSEGVRANEVSEFSSPIVQPLRLKRKCALETEIGYR